MINHMIALSSKNKNKGLVSILIAIVFFTSTALLLHPQTQSANLTSASVTLSNSRLSFKARLASGNTLGSSIITIKETGTATHTSESTAQIRVDDQITIGSNNYEVIDTNPPGLFQTDSGLLASDIAEDTIAYSRQLSNLAVRFKTATAIADGNFRLLIPAASAGASDGVPDPGFFDFSAGTPTVQCPGDTSGYTFGSATAVASGETINGQLYHVFTCPYTGAGGVETDFTAGTLFTISGVINPAPRETHTLGQANSHTLLIQHRDASNVTRDSTAVAVGVIEAVKVTATVDPTIEFTISGVADSVSKCGVNPVTDNTVTTTATAVPFGVLSLNSFVNAAQELTVTTNGTDGYAVTAIANDQLGKDGQECDDDDTDNINCIRDTRGDVGATMTHVVTNKWTDPSDQAGVGFGYSLAVGSGTPGVPTTPFSYDDTTGNCAGGNFCAKQFADDEDTLNPQDPQEIMTNDSVAANHQIDVCYRIVPAVTNAAGEYQNSITYTATARF
jgi:hypothetical protein